MGVHTWLYRVSGGRIGHRVPGLGPSMLLLDHVGAKSGAKRTCPLLYIRDGESVVIINTNAGHERTPSWSLNLKADPRAEVEIGRRKIPVVARIAEGEEREELWRRHNAQYSGFDIYKENIERRPEVFVLDPAAEAAAA
jgi:deazaflavin-dependent oxidoreductase (nitroreductase family)